MAVLAPTHTQRSAFALARHAYQELFRSIADREGEALSRGLRAEYERGSEYLADALGSATDVSLSEDAHAALLHFIGVLQDADPEAQVMWVGLFPAFMADIRRDGMPAARVETEPGDVEMTNAPSSRWTGWQVIPRGGNREPAAA
jgi:hypothetical protein